MLWHNINPFPLLGHYGEMLDLQKQDSRHISGTFWFVFEISPKDFLLAYIVFFYRYVI